MGIDDKGDDLYLSDSDVEELMSEDDGDTAEDGQPAELVRQLRGALKEPRFKTMSVRQLNDLVHQGNVELSPIYQRDVVWTEPKQMALIQSLFLNYFVPPVIFAVNWNDELGDYQRICIDGKQRCTSITKFIAGKIPFRSPATGDRFWYTLPPGVKYAKELPKALKTKFDNISIQLVEYENMPMNQQRDIFQRVQLGVALSASERLQALPGPWGEWVVELVKKYVMADGALASYLPKLETTRARPFSFTLAFVMMAVDGDSCTSISAHQQAKFLERTDKPDAEFVRRVEMAMGIFIELAVDHYSEAFGTVERRVAPVEFSHIAYLIYKRMGGTSMTRLAQLISDMRKFVRTKHVDIRNNEKVSGDLFKFINTTAPRNKGSGGMSAAEQWEGDGGVTLKETQALKRLRAEEARDGTYLGGRNLHIGGSAVIDGLRSNGSANKKTKTSSGASASRGP